MLLTIILFIFASGFSDVQCQSNTGDSSKSVGIYYLIPISKPIHLNGGDDDNEIEYIDRKLLPLPKLILALVPSTENEKLPVEKTPGEVAAIEDAAAASSEARQKRSPGGGGGGCNQCGYNPGGGGGGRGGGGGGSGSWSKSSSSASSGSWGGGGGKYHG